MKPPHLRFEPGQVVLSGEWTLNGLLPVLTEIQFSLSLAAKAGHAWDLSAIERLDSAAAALLWQSWGKCWPPALQLPDGLRPILERAAKLPDVPPPSDRLPPPPVEMLGGGVLRFLREMTGLLTLYGTLLLDFLHLTRHPGEIPWKEFSANLYKSGTRALPVTALVGFLIGVTLSYLSSLQLKIFGADAFIVNILGIAIIRELGPVLVAVLVAGRSGSAMTAQIGVMRVTEEIDALAVMGISRTQRVILPKVAALSVVMPLLVLWISAAALFGGMVSAKLQLGLSMGFFIESLPRAVPVANLYIGLCKGVVFGFTIALIACHFGLRVRPNTESLSANTTVSVVTSITAVIILDALFAIMTRNMGMPSL